MNSLLYKITLCTYFAATVVFVVYLVKPRDVLARAGRWLLYGGVALHALFTFLRYLEAGYTPITNLHEALSFFSLAIVGAFIAFDRRYRAPILGSFVTPVALVMMLLSFGFPASVSALKPALKSRWLAAHTMFAFLGYAVFAVAFGAAIMYLIQEHFLKSRKLGPMYQKLPSLDVLDDINYRALTFGFPFLTLAIITGAVWAETAWGTYWSWDPKETWSLITWFVYAALLHGRLTTGWRGRKAAILAIIGFFVLLFTFLGVNLLLPGLHSYK